MADRALSLIEPPGRQERPPEVGPAPELRWIPTDALRVDPAYQRRVTERAARNLVERIATGFAWARFGALTVARVADAFVVIDGQHRAAAALWLGIPEVPALIVSVPDVSAEAGAFVGLNRDRRNVTALHLFWAQLAEGDEEADAVDAGVRAGGGELLRVPRLASDCSVGQTSATKALRDIARRKGKAGVARAVRIAVDAGLAPVQALHLKAIAALLWEPEFEIPDATISRVMLSAWEDALDGADLARIENGQPRHRCVALQIAQRANGARA